MTFDYPKCRYFTVDNYLHTFLETIGNNSVTCYALYELINTFVDFSFDDTAILSYQFHTSTSVL